MNYEKELTVAIGHLTSARSALRTIVNHMADDSSVSTFDFSVARIGLDSIHSTEDLLSQLWGDILGQRKEPHED